MDVGIPQTYRRKSADPNVEETGWSDLKKKISQEGVKSPPISGNQSRSSRRSDATPRVINYNINSNVIINNNFFLSPDIAEPIHSHRLMINSKQNFSLITSSVEESQEAEEKKLV